MLRAIIIESLRYRPMVSRRWEVYSKRKFKAGKAEARKSTSLFDILALPSE